MSNPITFNDILTAQNDYMANYTTGNVDDSQRIRQANRSIEWWQRRLILPSDKRIQTFKFYQDTLWYDTNDDLNEVLGLFYHNDALNLNGEGFDWRPDYEILRITGSNWQAKYWTFTTLNRSKQIGVLAGNRYPGAVLDPLDLVGSWVAQGDASNLHVDNNQYVQGGASLAFDVTRSTGRASLYNGSFNHDLRNPFNYGGMFKFYAYLASISFSTIDINFFSSPTDYYKISVTANADGTAWTINSFENLLGFLAENAIMVGSPNLSAINACRIDFNLLPSVTTITNMRVDDLYFVMPDELDLVYASNIKGTDSTGLTDKVTLDDPSDIPSFGEYAPDLVDAIAMRGALMLMPQLRKDLEFSNMYKSEVKNALETYGKIFPRKRVINMGKTILRKR